jgi:hypothetical protein
MTPITRPLALPLPPAATEAVGIVQSDIIVRTAIIAGLMDMRANPWLLDFAFAGVTQDKLTFDAYGEKTRDAAKAWFLKSDIPVVMAPRPALENNPPPLGVSIQALSSDEDATTLADVHHDPREDLDAERPALTPVFDAARYDSLTGHLTIPTNIAAGIVLSTAMKVVDGDGVSHPIIDVIDHDVVQLAPGTVGAFRNCTLHSIFSPLVTSLESVVYRENFAVVCHALSEPEHLIWLHSLVVFVLLRYKEALMEARGFERSSFRSAAIDGYQDPSGPMWFTRQVTLTGFVRNIYPKAVGGRLLSVTSIARPDGGTPLRDIEEVITDSEFGDLDGLTGRKET